MSDVTAAQRVKLARAVSRPGAMDYIDALFTDLFVCKGDRLHREDPCVFGAIARFHGKPVTVIGTRKGRTFEEKMKYNFGMPSPEGYRKAQRLMRSLTVPVIAVVIGEAGSGGALALAVGNRVILLENAVYSVLSPEGFASILWKDAGRVAEACEVMKITARDLRKLGVVDEVIPEPENPENLTTRLRLVDAAITKHLDAALRLKDPARHRQEKFAAMGRAWIQGGNP